MFNKSQWWVVRISKAFSVGLNTIRGIDPYLQPKF